MNKKIMFYIMIVVLIIIALLVLSSSFYTVQENEYAFVVRFSEIVEIKSEPGLCFKIPLIDDIMYFPKTKLFYEIKESDVYTADIKNMTADCFIIWEIEEPRTFYKKLGSVLTAEDRIYNITYNALKNTISNNNQGDIVGFDPETSTKTDISTPSEPEANGNTDENKIADERMREYLNTVITELARENANNLGIRIVDVKIKSFELQHDNEQDVFKRMISARVQAATWEKSKGEEEANIIKNGVDRTTNIMISDAKAKAEQIIANGESEYMRILAEAYKGTEREEFYTFIRGLDALKASLAGNEKTVILDRESILAKILISPQE